jgi:hypothetical protein
MTWLVLFAGIFTLTFGFVVLFGAPYLPTMNKQGETALDLLNLKPGQTLLELGCGDGRVLKLAAQRGIVAIGYEINPLLVLIAKLHTWRYRALVSVHMQNFWSAEWPKADGIYVFLLNKYMKKLDTKITKNVTQPVRLVSFAFPIPGKKAQSQRNGLFLYLYK